MRPHPTPLPSETQPALAMHVFAIGQADSMLFIGPAPERRTLLVDVGEVMGGDGRNHQRIADRLEALLGGRSLDTVLLTHFHGDHTGFWRNGAGQASGLFGLVEQGWTIDTLIDRGDDLRFRTPTRAHQGVMKAAPGWIEDGRLGERISAVAGGTRIDLGEGVEVEVLASAGQTGPGDPGVLGQFAAMPTSENDYSIALEVSVGSFELFTAGDLNGALQPEDGEPKRSTKRFFGERFTNIEQHLLDQWQDREANVEIYRANHHGSRFSTTQPFLDALNPEVILYSTGGQYGHPTRDVVVRGAATAAQLVTSAVSATNWPHGLPEELGHVVGEIVVEVDAGGAGYTVNGGRRRSFSDEEEAQGADSPR